MNANALADKLHSILLDWEIQAVALQAAALWQQSMSQGCELKRGKMYPAKAAWHEKQLPAWWPSSSIVQVTAHTCKLFSVPTCPPPPP